MFRFLIALPFVLTAASGLAQDGARRPPKPNVVLILADDLGWADLGCYGSTFYETPNLDRLAREGVRFTQAYAACPVCSPTRSSVMTGKYPTRTGVTDYINQNRANQPDKWARATPLRPAEYRMSLPPGEVTIAEALKEAGYATGIFGKWHLSDGPGTLPDKHGFDVVYCGELGRGLFGPDRGDLTTDAALRFVEANKDRPFFLYLPHNLVHIPLNAKPELEEKYRKKAAALNTPDPKRWGTEGKNSVRLVQDNPTYAAMTESLDQNVGRLLARLAALGIADRTLVVFTSDNGGLSTAERQPTSNLPLRAGKGWLYEGGVRVPLIVKWPGLARAGATVATPVTSTDYYPTILDALGLPARPKQHLDGVSIVPLLKGGGELAPRPLYWHYPHYGNQGGRPGAAVRRGDWKLIDWFEGRTELFNIKDDPGERADLADKHPERVKELRGELAAWQKETGAKFPTPNPKK